MTTAACLEPDQAKQWKQRAGESLRLARGSESRFTASRHIGSAGEAIAAVSMLNQGFTGPLERSHGLEAAYKAVSFHFPGIVMARNSKIEGPWNTPDGVQHVEVTMGRSKGQEGLRRACSATKATRRISVLFQASRLAGLPTPMARIVTSALPNKGTEAAGQLIALATQGLYIVQVTTWQADVVEVVSSGDLLDRLK